MGITNITHRDQMTVHSRENTLKALARDAKQLTTLGEVIQTITFLEPTENTRAFLGAKVASSAPSIKYGLKCGSSDRRISATYKVKERQSSVGLSGGDILLSTFGVPSKKQSTDIIVPPIIDQQSANIGLQ